MRRSTALTASFEGLVQRNVAGDPAFGEPRQSSMTKRGGAVRLRVGNITFDMGFTAGLKAFTAAVLGGIGNIRGAVLGGLIIGVIEAFVGGSSFSNYRDAIAFVILIVILLFRPSGLFGKYQPEKV